MLSRRTVLAAPAAAMAAPGNGFVLCMHQTTSASAGFRKSLEGYAKAGIRFVEVIPPHVEPFVKQEGAAAARRLLADLGLKAVSSGGVRGLGEGRPGALDELKGRAELIASIGVDRMVCPCAATEKYTAADYQRGAENLARAGEVAKQHNVTVMLEFMRGSTFVGSLPTALKMIRQAAHPNVRVVFDCYHFWAGLSKFEDLDMIRPAEIHHVHFQDVPDMPRELLDSTTREIPGDGVSPLPRILRKLKEKGYSGPLSVELFYPRFQQGDPYEIAREIREKSERVIASV